MLTVELPRDLLRHAPCRLGHSGWKLMGQDRFDAFAETTDDAHWSHTDPARAASEMPGGVTIAQGFLTLSLVTGLLDDVLQIRACARWVNYGLDRLRFTAPVASGDRVRLSADLKSATALDAGAVRLQYGLAMEIENRDRPAFVADFIAIAYQ